MPPLGQADRIHPPDVRGIPPTRSTLAPPLTGLTCGLQVIEACTGREWSSGLCGRLRHIDGHRQAPARDGARFQRVVSELDQGSHGRGPGEGVGRMPFPWPTAYPDRAATGVNPGGAVEGSEPAGTGQAPGGQPLDHPTGRPVESRVEITASARSKDKFQIDPAALPRGCYVLLGRLPARPCRDFQSEQSK